MKQKRYISLFIAIILVSSGFALKGYWQSPEEKLINGNDKSDATVGLNIGDKAPDFEQTGVDGKTIKLSSLKKRIVLIDFWASWCRPCRYENPTVVAAYNKYHKKKFNGGKKGFEVLSVSLDQNSNSWKKAIEADGLIWKYHTSDLKGWGNEVAQLYKITSIPNNFLIDGNGIIIAKNLRGPTLEQELEKLVKK